jgi:hypothetical protein
MGVVVINTTTVNIYFVIGADAVLSKVIALSRTQITIGQRCASLTARMTYGLWIAVKGGFSVCAMCVIQHIGCKASSELDPVLFSRFHQSASRISGGHETALHAESACDGRSHYFHYATWQFHY